MSSSRDTDIAPRVDAKQSCAAHGWSILTASFLVRDKFRRASFRGGHHKRIQGLALTSHCLPVLQATVHLDNHEKNTIFCDAALDGLTSQIAWWECTKITIEASSTAVRHSFLVVDLSTNFSYDGEAQNHRGKAAGDYFARRNTEESRHLPTVDLFSAPWKGFIQRLHLKQKPLFAKYLGETFTQNGRPLVASDLWDASSATQQTTTKRCGFHFICLALQAFYLAVTVVTNPWKHVTARGKENCAHLETALTAHKS